MKFVLIGKCNKSDGNGPSNIMWEMQKEFRNIKNVEIQTIFFDKKCSKFKMVLNTFKTILKEKNACINVHTSGFLIPLMVYLLSLLNKKNFYCLTVHGIYNKEISIKEKKGKDIYCFIQKYLYVHFPNLVCVSDMLKEDIKTYFNRKERIYVIPNATNAANTNVTYKKEAYTKIIMLGGLKKGKGILETLELFSYFINIKGMKARLDIYGYEEGTHTKEWLFKTAKELNIEKFVLFRGKLSEKQKLYEEIATADFQLCLSHYDSFNVAIAESLVLGCPCIATKQCGAAAYIKENESGIVIDTEDVNYKEKIWDYVSLFKDDNLKRKKVFENRYKYIEQFSWRNVCETYIKLAEGELNK